MFALMRASEGLLTAHLGLLCSFLVGAALFPWCDWDDARRLDAAQTMLRVIATTGFGLAIFGFAAFALASAGAFKPWIYFPFVAALSVGGSCLWKQKPLSARYWRGRWAALSGCWDLGALIVYYVLVVLAFPAIIGNLGGSDAVGYHLVYGYEWAKTGHLVIDPFLRLPFYASNFILLFAVLMSMHLDMLANFLSWATALLTALGVYSASRIALGNRLSPLEAAISATALALSVVFSAAYLRWMDTAYIDTAIGAFALFALLCVVIALAERRYQWLAVGALTAGFLMGMKGSFFVLGPVFLLVLVIALRQLKPGLRATCVVLALLVVSAAPWYARNLVLAGDIAPPAFNVALFGRDGLMTKGEWQQNQADLSTPKTPIAVAALPARAFFRAQNRVFREYGVTGLMLLLYVPILAVVVLFAIGRPIDGPLLISAVYVTLLVGYWVATSSLLRYATLFYPSLAVALALTIATILPVRRFTGLIATVVCALTLIPGPDTANFYHETFSSHFRYLADAYKSDDYYLDRFSPDYRESRFVAALMKDSKQTGRVYMLGPRVQYNFAADGIQAIGDWMGPAGFFRLYRAVDARKGAAFMRELDVDAVLITPDKVLGGLGVPLERQLRSGGYCEVEIPQSNDRLFVSFAGRCARGISQKEARIDG